MALDQDAYLSGVTAGVGGGSTLDEILSPIGGASGVPGPTTGYVDVGNDNGRGPGTRGSRGTGITGAGTGVINTGNPNGAYTQPDIDKILRGMPPERIAGIQRQMQIVGLLPAEYKSWGFVENSMRSGFAELLEASNMRGSSYVATLDTLTSMGPGSIEDARMDIARKRASLEASFNTRLNTYESSDPASVRQTAEQAFQQALGRKPKPDEMEKFTAAFLGRERGAQDAVFDAQDGLEAASRSRALASFDAEASGMTQSNAGAAAPSASEDGMSEAQILKQRLARFIADAPGKIGLGSETRSLAEQQRLYDLYKSGKGALAAKPGTSKHGNGRANDLKYENDAVRQWALANASRYGLAFPIYDPKKPRSKDESWHIEVMQGPGVKFTAASTPSAPAGPGAAPISQDVTVQRQDAGAQAIEFARNSNPVETAAYDIGGQFESLLQILNRGVTS